jgi:predicted O-methyltransferase YrrM
VGGALEALKAELERFGAANDATTNERPEYPGSWPHPRRVLRSGGLLIVDNATSHAEQMAPFVALVTADPEFATCLIPVGNGEFLAVKTSS